MAASFENEDAALKFESLFDKNPVVLPDGREVGFSSGVELSSSGVWECVVTPTVGSEYLNGHGGPSDAGEKADLTAIGRVLYARLRSAPPFVRALCGTEVMDWLSHAEFLERADDFSERSFAYRGVVVSDGTWKATGSRDVFVPFGADTRWIPWEGPE